MAINLGYFVKVANKLDSSGNYDRADKIDLLIAKIANAEVHRDSMGVNWQNVGLPKDHGLIGAGYVWERLDNKSKQIVPVGQFPDSKPKQQAPHQTQQQTQTQPAQTNTEESSLMKDWLGFDWANKVETALN